MSTLRRSRRKRQPPAHLAPPPDSKKSKPCSPSTSASSLPPVTVATTATAPTAAEPPGAYETTKQTLFLDDDNVTCTWHPVPPSARAPSVLHKHFYPFGNDVHAYFTSPPAAKNAAILGGISIYRHIGQVTLRKFQQLEDLDPAEQWFPAVRKCTETFVNMRIPLTASWSEDERLVNALESLSAVPDDPWPKPYIVALARRDDVMRACDTQRYQDDVDLQVQIFAGRLLFELIACPDIRHLFSALTSPMAHDRIPDIPEYPAVFQQSPPDHTDHFRPNFYDILRCAESTGYADLDEDQRARIEAGISVTLYDYQRQTVRWMIDKENGPHTLNDYFWEERSFTPTPHATGGKYYYFPLSGEVRLNRPPRTRGGMITEEMGLGKTVEALALIVAQKSDYKAVEVDVWCEENPTDVRVVGSTVHLSRLRTVNQEKKTKDDSGFQHGDELLEDANDVEFPGNVKVRRWPAKTTLIICPKSLVGQWKQEIAKLAPSLTCFEWVSSKNSSHLIQHGVGENAKDIVLATYDMVRTDSTLSKICWKRLILDEAQITRRSAAQVAKDVFNLRSDIRFLMTGTPLVNSINDLKGQLAVLKIWPFTLDEDGFWETHVLRQIYLGVDMTLLKALLKVTMMRHSKGQQLSVPFTKRTYKTIKVDLANSYRACYYYVLASCLDELESQCLFNVDTRHIRIFLRLLISLCLSPYLLDAVTLDITRRHTWSRKTAGQTSNALRSIRKVSAQEAIQFVAETGMGILRDSQRVYAMGEDISADTLERFKDMPIEELRSYVVSRNLLSQSRAQRTKRERLCAIAAGGTHRLETDTITDLRRTATELGIAEAGDVRTWSRAKTLARLRLHYDLVNGIRRLRTVHESGFAAIMKLVQKKGNPNCPVCLTECDGRVAVTKCGHLYCLDCIMMLLGGNSSVRRCAICRRDLSTELIVEIQRQNEQEAAKEEQKEEQVSTFLEQGSDLTKAGTLECLGIPLQLAGDDDNAPAQTRIEETVINSDASDDETVEQPRMSARDAWRKFEQCEEPPAVFNTIGRNERFPSLCAEFLRHLFNCRSGRSAPPKLNALIQLIRSKGEGTKFCVVASSIESLRVISQFLDNEGITCVGAGLSSRVPKRAAGGSSSGSSSGSGSGSGSGSASGGKSDDRGDNDTASSATAGPRRNMNMNRSGGVSSMAEAAERFATDATVRVYLLNPANAAGLTLTAASVVVFMETLVRVADEIQLAARVHRIGQTKDVEIVRIVARNTLEEQIVERRGTIAREDESQALAVSPTNEASDRMILQLFGFREFEQVLLAATSGPPRIININPLP